MMSRLSLLILAGSMAWCGLSHAETLYDTDLYGNQRVIMRNSTGDFYQWSDGRGNTGLNSVSPSSRYPEFDNQSYIEDAWRARELQNERLRNMELEQQMRFDKNARFVESMELKAARWREESARASNERLIQAYENLIRALQK